MTELDAGSCDLLSEVVGIGASGVGVRLARLDLSGCPRLASLDGLGACPELREATLGRCRALADVATSRKRVELQMNQLQTDVDKMQNIVSLPSTTVTR